MLLWVRRAEWGLLLIVHGLWAHAEHHHDHLSFFASAAIFSMCTDALALAADAGGSQLIVLTTWVLLGCKVAVVAMLVVKREAFV